MHKAVPLLLVILVLGISGASADKNHGIRRLKRTGEPPEILKCASCPIYSSMRKPPPAFVCPHAIHYSSKRYVLNCGTDITDKVAKDFRGNPYAEIKITSTGKEVLTFSVPVDSQQKCVKELQRAACPEKYICSALQNPLVAPIKINPTIASLGLSDRCNWLMHSPSDFSLSTWDWDSTSPYVGQKLKQYAAACQELGDATPDTCSRLQGAHVYEFCENLPNDYCEKRSRELCEVNDTPINEEDGNCCKWSSISRTCLNTHGCPGCNNVNGCPISSSISALQQPPSGGAALDGPVKDFAARTSLNILVFGDSGSSGLLQTHTVYAMFAHCAIRGGLNLATTVITGRLLGSVDPELTADELQLWRTHAHRGCDFAIVTGDNIYGDGPTPFSKLASKGGRDPLFYEQFEQAYSLFGNFPFLMSYGNHDYGTKHSAEWLPHLAFNEAAFQEIDYGSKCTRRWIQPHPFYRLGGPIAHRFPSQFDRFPTLPDWLLISILDTNLFDGVVINDDTKKAVEPVTYLPHPAYYNKQMTFLMEADKTNVAVHIVAAHHAPFSHGKHTSKDKKNHGKGEAIKDAKDWPKLGVDWMKGGKVDIFLAGHDHLMEHTKVYLNDEVKKTLRPADIFLLGNAAKPSEGFSGLGSPDPYMFVDDPEVGAQWSLAKNSAHSSNGFGILEVKNDGKYEMTFYRVDAPKQKQVAPNTIVPLPQKVDVNMAYKCQKNNVEQSCTEDARFKTVSDQTSNNLKKPSTFQKPPLLLRSPDLTKKMSVDQIKQHLSAAAASGDVGLDVRGDSDSEISKPLGKSVLSAAAGGGDVGRLPEPVETPGPTPVAKPGPTPVAKPALPPKPQKPSPKSPKLTEYGVGGNPND